MPWCQAGIAPVSPRLGGLAARSGGCLSRMGGGGGGGGWSRSLLTAGTARRARWGWGCFLAAGPFAVPARRWEGTSLSLSPSLSLPPSAAIFAAPGAVPPVLWQRGVGTGVWQPAGPGASCSSLGVRIPLHGRAAGRREPRSRSCSHGTNLSGGHGSQGCGRGMRGSVPVGILGQR